MYGETVIDLLVWMKLQRIDIPVIAVSAAADILRISNPVSAGIGAILLPPRQSLARSPLWRPIQRLNCVACWYLFRCLSASCFRRIRTAQSGQYFARLDFGVNAVPHTAHRFTLSRLWMISAYSAPSSGRTAARNHRHSNE